MASVILVEDEESLLQLLARYLRRQGHEVTACASGTSALEATHAEGAGFEIAIIDLTLPDMSGEDLLKRLLGEEAQLKAVVSSGRPYTVEALPEALRPRVGSILKPYLPQMLLDEMQRLLEGAGAEEEAASGEQSFEA